MRRYVGSAPSSVNDLKLGVQWVRYDGILASGTFATKRRENMESFLLERNSSCQQPWAFESLANVLTRNSEAGGRLTRHDRYRVDIASSVLHLSNTLWLDTCWGKDDISFVQRPGLSVASLCQHPFVCRSWEPTANNDQSLAQRAGYRVIRNQTLYSLAILLIGLRYGNPIEALQTPDDLDCEGTLGIVWCTV